MSARLSNWFPIGLMVLVGAMSWWLDRKVQPPEARLDGSGRHDPDYIVENFRVTRLGEDGKPRYELVAARMTHYPDNDSTTLAETRFERVGRDAPPMSATAKRARLSSDAKEIHLEDDVEVERQSAGPRGTTTLRTQYLLVLPEDDRAETDHPVEIRDSATIIRAVGLKLDNKTGVTRLMSKVRATYDRRAARS